MHLSSGLLRVKCVNYLGRVRPSFVGTVSCELQDSAALFVGGLRHEEHQELVLILVFQFPSVSGQVSITIMLHFDRNDLGRFVWLRRGEHRNVDVEAIFLAATNVDNSLLCRQIEHSRIPKVVLFLLE